MISRREAEEDKYAGKFKNTLHTSDSKERRESGNILPSQYEQRGTTSKPDDPGISLDRTDGGYAAMTSGRYLYGYCH